MNHLDSKLGYTYNHHDVQNELLNIMHAPELQEKLAVIRGRNFLFIMGDEETEISNKEQLSFSVRTVGDNLNVDENFLSFFEIAKSRVKLFLTQLKISS